MNYTLHQLKIFSTVVETSSITKTADILYLTQPAVSIQLKKFQEQFDIPLTETIGRKLYITDFGHEIAKSAEEILNQVDAINYKTKSYNNELTGKLKLSIVSTGKYIMPYFLSDFININNTVDIKMDVTNKSLVVDSLINNQVDFALVSTLPKDLKLNKIQLLENKLYLVGSPRLKSVSGDDPQKIFKNFPLIYREQGSATRIANEEYIKSHNIPTYKQFELTSNEAVKQAAISGLGYSIMPLIGIKNELKNGDLQIIEMDDLPITTHWHLVWLKAKKLSPIASAYIEYLKQNKNEIINKEFNWTKQW